MKLILFIFALIVFTVNARNLTEDKVDVPQYPTAYEQEKKFFVSSGYLDTNNNGKAFYMFLSSQLDQFATKYEDKPLILWMQGGNGCSSLDGWLKEFGPYLMKYPATQIRRTFYNEYAWNKLANVLFIEAPLNTGFSKYTGSDTYTYGDERVATETFEALQYFYSQNPEYKSSQLLIGGEGYAGIFIPLVAEKIVAANQGKEKTDANYIKLTNLLLGNAEIKENKGSLYLQKYDSIQFLDNHGLFGPEEDDTWYECVSDRVESPECEFFRSQSSGDKIQLNPFNVNAKCQKKVSGAQGFEPELGENSQCKDWKPMEDYFNSNYAAFHIQKDLYDERLWNSTRIWKTCSYFAQEEWQHKTGGSQAELVELLKNNKDISVVMFYGINDSAVPFNTGEENYRHLVSQAELDKPRDYTKFLDMEGQIGGWSEGNDNLQLVRVRAAGHQVAHDNPSAAYVILLKTIIGNQIVD